MKFHQEFRIPERINTVWLFFEQPLSVAKCIPGFESAEGLHGDSLAVRATQKLGPMSATFEAKVRITEKVHEERIEFNSTGKAVRGAVGNFRSRNTVVLKPVGEETDVMVEGEVVLAGVLGTIGHAVITKQAKKVTAEFAHNLEQALSGKGTHVPDSGPVSPPVGRLPGEQNDSAFPVAETHRVMAEPSRDPWARAAALLSASATIIGLIILWRLWD